MMVGCCSCVIIDDVNSGCAESNCSQKSNRTGESQSGPIVDLDRDNGSGRRAGAGTGTGGWFGFGLESSCLATYHSSDKWSVPLSPDIDSPRLLAPELGSEKELEICVRE